MSHIKALRDGKYATKRDTNIERTIEQQLRNDGLVLGRDYFKQVPLPAGAPRFVVDFFIPTQNLVIEGYGCFWHKCTACGYDGPRSIDEKRKEVLLGEGLSLHIVWGHEL
jgi:G:T-mismatch repair DNA endonuclease (very short patch repair protein)